MADKLYRHTRVRKKFLFKREKHSASANLRRTIRTRHGRQAQNCGQM